MNGNNAYNISLLCFIVVRLRRFFLQLNKKTKIQKNQKKYQGEKK